MNIIEYPKMLYREPGGEHKVVNGPEEESALKHEWGIKEDALLVSEEPEEEAVEVMASGEEVSYKVSELRTMRKERLLEMAESHGLSFAPEEVTREDLIGVLLDLNP